MNNTAIITGGNKGIGADLASALLQLDYTVVSLARHAPEIKHKNLHSVTVDLLDPDAVSDASAKVASEFEVTHLIHNAGLIWPNLIEDAGPEDITGLSQLHLGSALTLLKAVLPSMKKNQFGRVMFNGSCSTGCTYTHGIWRNKSRHDRYGTYLGTGTGRSRNYS